MNAVELRDPDAARRYVLQSVWLQRVTRPAAARLKPPLEWALQLASDGHPLPPVGFVADLGHIALGSDRTADARQPVEIPGWPPTSGRSYEDHVLGKLYADWTFERAADALRRFSGRDLVRGLAYVTEQVRERAGLGGVELPPAVLRTLLAANPDDLLAEGYESLGRDGPDPLLVTQYEALVSGFRRLAEVLAPEDVIALEQKTAVADLGQYIAHRQILQTTARLESHLPPRPVRPLAGRKEVPTRVADEDVYPVGGYSSISTKGSIESLLHSQLAYMEGRPEPDLFDVKFVRDELFYYSRDENQFLRRRRAFVFVLHPSLTAARFKDPELPVQRVVLAVSAVLALVRRLSDWLSTDALRFEVVVVHQDGQNVLRHETELLTLLLREPIERGTARITPADDLVAAAKLVTEAARHAQTHALAVAASPLLFDPDGAAGTTLGVNSPRPTLANGSGAAVPADGDDPFDSWAAAVVHILQLWV